MANEEAESFDPAILSEQAAYYRARATEYDEWWFRTGRYDHGATFRAAWFADVAAVEAALHGTLASRRPRTALELACGTGLFTRHLAPHVTQLLALDASTEVLALNRARVAANNVVYAQQDLFAWQPAARYDLVFMSFWLSHVPDERFDEFWRNVRNALVDGGVAYVVDSAYDRTSTAANHARPDQKAGVVTRKLNDGRQFRIVKVFHKPAVLNARLAGLGLHAAISTTARYFIHGTVTMA
ncbi:MAG: methyltransferase domain-containing protein [Betaproteobacteria bacterium]